MDNIYVIRRKEPTGYDENSAVMVIAGSPAQARRFAAAAHADEGEEVWLKARYSACSLYGTTLGGRQGSLGVALVSFRAG